MSATRTPCADREARGLLRDLDRSLIALEYADHFTPKQAAEFLGRTIHILAKWRKQGSGPPWITHPDGWHVLYPFKGLVQWVVDQGGRRHRFTRFDKLHADGFMTEDEAAAFLGVGRATLARWRRDGKVAAEAVPSKFNVGGMMHLYSRLYLLSVRPCVKPRKGLGRGRGTAKRLAEEARSDRCRMSKYCV
jgi:hypothetical protein